MSISTTGNINDNTVQLKRGFGLITGCFVIIGGVIGSGIFVSPQGVLIGSGSFGLSLIIWTFCGILSLCGAFTYAEIGTIIPKSGSAYYYLKEVFGDCVAFVYMFTFIFLKIPAGGAIVSMTCAEYLSALFFNDRCGSSLGYITKTLAATIIIFVGAINCKSVSLTGTVNLIFTGAKMVGLGVIIVGGLVFIFNGDINNLSLENSFRESSTNLVSLSEAILSGMWAYSGWDGLNYITEEMKKPERNLLRSMIVSIPTVTALYFLANISYFIVLSPDVIVASPSVAKSWSDNVMPKMGWFVAVAVIISTFGASVCGLLKHSRLALVAAREGHLPMMVSMVHIKYLTPAPAVVLLSALSVMYIYFGTIIQLIQYAGVVEWFFHGMVGVALLILRKRNINIHKPSKTQLICPILVILSCIPLFFAPIIGNPQWGYLFALFLLLFGVILWFIGIKLKLSNVPGIGKMTAMLQLLVQVSPS